MGIGRIEIHLFGGFNLRMGETVYSLEDLLGRQLSALFALIILGGTGVVNKEYLIEKLWQDSENPASALKYAIHRLRSTLKKVSELEGIELVQTLKNGYNLNPDFIDQVDVLQFSEAYAKRTAADNNEHYLKMYELYKGHLLKNIDAEWLDAIREYYFRQFLFACESLCASSLKNKETDMCVQVAQRVLSLDEYNEQFNGYYLKALILNNQYNAALKHYDQLSKKFLTEFGYAMANEDNELFKLVSAYNGNDSRKSIHEVASEFSGDDIELGAFFSDYMAFKKMYQFELRNSLRMHRGSYLVLFELRCPKSKLEGSMQTFMAIIAESLRINDVYTQINQSQIGLMLRLTNEDDAYIVIERLLNKFYRKYAPSAIRINYYVTDILKEAKENLNLIRTGQEVDPIRLK